MRLIMAIVLSAILFAVPASMHAQTTAEESELTPPYVPSATFAQMALASNLQTESLFTEPVAMLFIAYGFGKESVAIENFQPLVNHYFEQAEANRGDGRWPYDMASVGRLGDEQAAFQSESRESFNGATGKDVHVLTRLGQNILYVRTISLGGDTIEFVSEYLADFTSISTPEPASLLPSLADLPIGWELTSDPADYLPEVSVQPTAVPTAAPTSVPTPTQVPTPTLVPSPTPIPPTPTPVPTISITVHLRLDLENVWRYDPGLCIGAGPYEYMEDGVMFSIRAPIGKQLVEVNLEKGVRTPDDKCVWEIAIPELAYAPSYRFAVGSEELGSFSLEELQSLDGPLVIDLD